MKPYMNRDLPGDVAVSHAFYDWKGENNKNKFK
jgi:hypothetical protein